MEIKGQFYSLRFAKTDLDCLKKLIDISLQSGINTIFLEIEKGLKYDTLPEISAPWAISKDTMRSIVKYIKDKSLKLIPVVPTFSHCNYFLKKHPEFSEGNVDDIYCACNPKTYELVFRIMGEIIELFEPEILHIGHDEAISKYDSYKRTSIFSCPVCQQQEPHIIFAKDIVKIHDFLKEFNIKTMMWADMLLDPKHFKSCCFDHSAYYGGAPDNLSKALDILPKDIIMCDWHYEVAKEYPSIDFLQDHGFNVLGASKFPVNTCLFTDYAQKTKSERFKGMIGTTWNHINKQTFPYLSKWTRHNGRCFNGEVLPVYLHKLMEKIRKNIKLSSEPLESGKISKIFSFNIDGLGVYYSKGWTDFFYKEYPNCRDEKITQPSRINSMMLKKERQGVIEYEFKTKDKTCFKELKIKIWMKNLGLNSIEIKTSEEKEYYAIDGNKTFRGNCINITPFVKGKDKVMIKFYAKNLKDKTLTALKRFDLYGIVINSEEKNQNDILKIQTQKEYS